MPETVLEVRRSRPMAIVQALFTAMLLALAVASVLHFWENDRPRDQLLAISFFTVILAVYGWHTLRLCWDRSPVVVVGPEGLYLPSALPDPIPWTAIHNANHPGGLLGRQRVDIDLDLATRARAKVGMRFAGDPIAGRTGSPGGILITTQSLDAKPAEIMAAIKRYWPPPETADER
jgi:hypothetical protein